MSSYVLEPIWDPIPGFDGLRPFKLGGAKIILHTTEGPTKPNWAQLKRGIPHFTVDFKTNQLWQHLKLNVAAYTLKGNGHSPNSDAGVVIQIEMVGFAKDTGDWPDGHYNDLRQLLGWICNANDIPWAFPVAFVGQEGSVRLDWDDYKAISGILGHQHVPYNDHWDPGALDMRRLR